MATPSSSHLATPLTTPPTLSKAQTLANVLSLASLFDTCVEAFNLIRPSKDSDHRQKVALAKLGLQQGRLLIFGDAVGISSPPATIARYMIPSHPGESNPDPFAPVNFAVRDLRLDEVGTNEKVRAALNEIAGRPTHLSREELMAKYGLKSPRNFSKTEYPALDINRLAAFREQFGLLQDLVRQTGTRAGLKRALSMTAQHWDVHDVAKFEDFVTTVRIEVDGLIALLGVKEQVDRGMKIDIKAFGWHPESTGLIVREDWEKLKLIQEACVQDYPEYVEITEVALKYLSEELKVSLESQRSLHPPTTFTIPPKPLPTPSRPTPSRPTSASRRASAETTRHNLAGSAPEPPEKEKQPAKPSEKEKQPAKPSEKEKQPAKPSEKEKRPGALSRLKSWAKSSNKMPRLKGVVTPPEQPDDPQRALSVDHQKPIVEYNENKELEPVRSKSLSAISGEPAALNLDTRLETAPTRDATNEGVDALDMSQLELVTTVNSLIDRRDMYRGVGRVETKDIRKNAHGWS